MKTKVIKEDIKALINYLWHDESKHYSEYPRKDHIFLVLKRLAREIDHKLASN